MVQYQNGHSKGSENAFLSCELKIYRVAAKELVVVTLSDFLFIRGMCTDQIIVFFCSPFPPSYLYS